jgi:hypothetical protein
MAGKKTYPNSASGYWKVTLNSAWTDEGFLYKPGLDIRMDECTLKRAIADDKVKNVVAAP